MKQLQLIVLLFVSVFFLQACDLSDQVNVVDVQESQLILTIDETYQLNVAVSADLATYVQYQSDDLAVATVSSEGLVTAVGNGVTHIQVRAGNGFDFVVVRVGSGSTPNPNEETPTAYVVTTEAEFIEALELGIYEITLGADITIDNEVVLSEPFEIIHQGFILDADFRIGEDFYGALAFFQDIRVGFDLYTGTINMNGLTSPIFVFSHFVGSINLEWDNPNEIAYYNEIVLPYQEVQHAIPISSLDDFANIATGEMYTFAKGTPFQKTTMSTGNNETYYFVNDIVGDVSLGDVHYLVETNTDVYIYDTNWQFIKQENVKYIDSPKYSNKYLPEYQSLTAPQEVLDFIQNNGTIINYTQARHQQVLNTFWDSPISYLNNPTFIGNYFGFYFIHFDNSLIQDADNIDMSNIDFTNVISEHSANAIVVNNIDDGRSIFSNIDFENVYADFSESQSAFIVGDFNADHIEFLDNDFTDIYVKSSSSNFGLLLGLNDEGSSVFITSTYIYNVYAHIFGSQSGVLVGEFDQGYVVMSEISLYDVDVAAGGTDFGYIVGEVGGGAYITMVDIRIGDSYLDMQQERSNRGFLVGEIKQDSVLIASHVQLDANSMIGNSYQVGSVIGQVDFSNVSLKDINVYELTIESLDSVGGLIGEIFESTVSIDYVVMYNINLTGEDEVGGLIGRVSYDMDDGDVTLPAFVTISRVDVNDIHIDAGRNAGGFIGLVYDSNIEIKGSELTYLTINASEFANVGGLIGIVDNDNDFEASITITQVDLGDIILYGNVAGGMIGKMNQSTLNITSAELFFIYPRGVNVSAGLVGEVNDSIVEVNQSFVNFLFIDSSPVFAGGFFGKVGYSQIDFNVVDLFIISEGLTIFGGLIADVTFSKVNGFVSDILLDFNFDIQLSDNFGRLFGVVDASYVELVYHNVNVDYNSLASANFDDLEPTYLHLFAYNVFNSTYQLTPLYNLD